MISSPGIGSGIDTGSLVQQLVALERQPIGRLFTEEAQFTAQISAFGQIKSVLSDFQTSLQSVNDVADFSVLKAESSDKDVLSATAASTASAGVFNLTVNRIADTHRLAAQNAFSDTDVTTIGTAGDELTIDVGGNSFDISYGGLTLGEVRDVINSSSSNTGVTASILKDDLGSRLLINSNETGSNNFVSLTYNNADPFNITDLNLDRDGDTLFTSADLDAEIVVDGQFTSTQNSNQVTDLINGVTLTLESAGTSLVKINPDQSAVQGAVTEFVDSYNVALKTIRGLREGVLSDDSVTLYAIENQLRNTLNTVVPGAGNYSSIYQAGISSTFVFGSASTDNGQLNVDATELLAAIQEDSDSIASLFAAPGDGLIPRMENIIDQFIKADGLIDGKTDSLTRRIDSLIDRREGMELRLGLFEQRLFDEFSSLDVLVAQLQSTGNFLTQQLAVLQPSAR